MRQSFRKYCSLFVIVLCLTGCSNDEQTLRMLVGTYTEGNDSEGVYLFDFNQNNGDYALLDTAMVGNPSFIIPSEDGQFAWSVGEYEDGRQSVYSYKLTDKRIDVMNSVPNGGGAPCNIVMASGRLYTSNYGGGTLSVFPVNEDGTVGEICNEFAPGKYISEAIDSQRQSRMHCAFLSPDGKYMFANDLGLDAVYRFDLTAEEPIESATLAYQFDTDLHPGPRHAVFSPDGRFVYLLHELEDLLTVFSYDNGNLRHISTQPAYSGGGHGSADIHISPDGRFLYTSHRLSEDGISIFAVNKQDGSVSNVGYCPTGKHPRNFAITPNGKYLLCACRDDNRIEIYDINPESGLLTFTGKSIEIPAPVCIRFE